MRYGIIIQSLDFMFHLVQLTTLYTIIFGILRTIELKSSKTPYYLIVLLILNTFIWLNSPSNPILSKSIEFSNARSSSLSDLSTYLRDQKVEKPLVFLANSENQFVSYELPFRARPLLFFNESYAPFSDQKGTISGLRNSIKESKLSEFLISRDVCVVALSWNSDLAEFDITVNTNYLTPQGVNQTRIFFTLARKDLVDLKKDWSSVRLPNDVEVWTRKDCLN
jgi:hypothetical protein